MKGLLELHGGGVEVRSEGLGRGAELIIRLPLAASGGAAGQQIRSAPAPLAPRRILVIEDNVDAAETLRTILEMDGHQADIAHDGREGIERARVFRPDIILCDLGLPTIDGYAVARALRSDPAMASVILIAVSGYALPADRTRAIEAGFDRHLGKPASTDQLREVLATTVRPGSA